MRSLRLRYQRRTLYVSLSLAEQIRAQSQAAGLPVSERLRTIIIAGLAVPDPYPEPPGPQTEMLLVYLRPAEDQLVRAQARRYRQTIAATLRRLIVTGMDAEEGRFHA